MVRVPRIGISAPTPADKIRAVINEIPASAMRPDPDDARQAPAFGGAWHSPEKEAYLSLGFEKILLLRDSPPHASQWKPWLQNGSIRLGGVSINFCIWRWIEEVPPQKPMPVLKGLAQPAALQLNLAIERINYTNIHSPAFAGLTDEEMEKTAEFIRVPLLQYLEKWLAYERRTQDKYGRHAVPVIGKLHEHWQSPRPLLVELHDHVAQYAAGFSLDRLYDPILERYQLDEEGGRKVFRVDGEPEVVIFLPQEDREYPRYDPGTVRIGSMEIPIEVANWSFCRLAEPVVDRSGKSIARLSFHLMLHPFSLRVEPQSRLPAGLDMATATRAVEHMRNSWFRYRNQRLQDTPERADVVII
jgi:hypothetical protein